MVDFKEWMEQEIGMHETSDGVELSYRGSEAKGSIYAKKDSENPNIYRVTRVWAEPQGKGYGKKLYMAALEFVTKKGGMLAPAKNSTSDSAANVWRSLYLSREVEKVPLRANDWTQSVRSKEMEKKYSGVRYSDPATYPPNNDVEFWTFNSGYRLGRSTTQPKPADQRSHGQGPIQQQNPSGSSSKSFFAKWDAQKTAPAPPIQRRKFPPGADELELEDM